jgi:hypothetical protein
MKRFSVYSLFLLFLFIYQSSAINCYSQQNKINLNISNPKSNGDIIVGYCTLEGITDTAFLSAYRQEYDHFRSAKEVMNQIYPLLDGITVTIVMGTWCSDSREQVPRFFRLFNDLEHSFADPVIICVDREKKAGDLSLDGLNIVKVPTFIVYFKGTELGRIIETPKTTMDQDFLDILKK